MNKKSFKQKIAIIIAIIIPFSIILPPESIKIIQASGKNNIMGTSNKQEIKNELSVKGTNSFGNLVGKEFEGKNNEQSENEGCNIFSIEIDKQTAKVSFETTENATLVVGIYNEDGTEMFTSAIKEVSAGETDADIVIEKKLPQYFYLRGFLVDSETLRPFCTSYETPNYTQEMQEFLTKTTDDFEQEKVLNLDGNIKNNFAVYSNKTIIIPEKKGINKVIEADDKNFIYVIENADESITSLKKGDIFSYQYNKENFLIVKVASLALDGTTVTITGEDTSLKEVFDYVKIDTEAGTKDAIVDMSEAEEGVEYKGIIKGEEDIPQKQLKKGADVNISGSASSDVLSYELNNIKFGSDDNKVEASGNIKGGYKISAKLYLSLSYQYLELKADYSVGIDISLSAKTTGKISLGRIGFSPCPGVLIELNPCIVVECSGTITINGTLKGTIGFSVSNKEGIKNLSSSPEFKPEIKGEITIFVGINLSPKIAILHEGIASAGIGATIGAEVKASLSLPLQEKSSSKVHTCKSCIEGEITGKAELKFEAVLLNSKKLKYESSLDISIKICDLYYSLDFNEGGCKTCPHYKYKIDISVIDNEKKAVASSNIKSAFSISKKGQNQTVENPDDFVETDYITTDENGKAIGYLPAGVYSLEVLAKGYIPVNKRIFVIYEPQDIRIKLEKAVPELSKTPVPIPSETPVPIPSENPSSMPSNTPGNVLDANVKFVSIGDHGSIGAVIEDGSLYMWGRNDYDQLGDGTRINRDKPIKILDNVIFAGLGNKHSGAVTEDGSLYMWGNNELGQLGDGTIMYKDIPEKVLDNVSLASFWYNNSGAITKDGNLYIWGGNKYDNKPIKMLDNVISASLGMSHIESITTHRGAVKKDGSLYMWGNNCYGQLGDGTKENKEEPIKVLDNVISVSLGDKHSGAITKDGSLYMWGNNEYGQLGDGTKTDKSRPVKVLDNVASIKVAGDCSGAITKDGSLYMWGNNEYGQLGDGTKTDKNRPVKVLDNVTLIEVVGNYNGAITKDGNLYMWGDNYYGQLGDGTKTDKNRPVKVLDNVTSISCGWNNSGAITRNGSLYMWGNNEYGQLGDGTMTNKYKPVKVLFPISNTSIISYRSKQFKSISSQSKNFTGLLPNECYNFYVLKSHSATNLLSPDNLLYMKQYISDSTGTINVTYNLSESSGYDEPFVVGMSRMDLSGADIEIPDLIYSGTEQSIYPKVSYKGNTLSEGKDYIVSGDFNVTDIGDYSITVSGTGFYKGEITKSFKVKGTGTSNPEISPSPSGSSIPNASPSTKPSGTGSSGGGSAGGGGASGGSGGASGGGSFGGGGGVMASTSAPVVTLTPSPSSIPVTTATTKPAQATNTVPTPKPSVSPDFETSTDNIFNNNSKKEITSNDVTLNKKLVIYNGKEKRPGVTVLNASLELTQNKDYTVSYLYNKNVGTAYVTVYGKGNYYGSVTKSFKIIPKGTPVKGKVKPKHKGFIVKWKKQPKSITGYQIQYSSSKDFKGKKAVIKTIKKKSVTKLKASKLKAKKKYYVRVRTYKTVKGKKYYSRWSKLKTVKTNK